MTTQTEALKLALEALDGAEALLSQMGLTHLLVYGNVDKSITAIKEALAQPEQEMVSKARYNRMRDDYNEAVELLRLAGVAAKNWNEHKLRCQLQGVDLDHNFAQPKEPEQEPVALMIYRGELCYKSQEDDQSFGMWCPVTQDLPFPEGTKFYTGPLQRTWVGLTDEEELQLAGMTDKSRHWLVAAVEAKLKEKNT